jgi:hypothetical protein
LRILPIRGSPLTTLVSSGKKLSIGIVKSLVAGQDRDRLWLEGIAILGGRFVSIARDEGRATAGTCLEVGDARGLGLISQGQGGPTSVITRHGVGGFFRAFGVVLGQAGKPFAIHEAASSFLSECTS